MTSNPAGLYGPPRRSGGLAGGHSSLPSGLRSPVNFSTRFLRCGIATSTGLLPVLGMGGSASFNTGSTSLAYSGTRTGGSANCGTRTGGSANCGTRTGGSANCDTCTGGSANCDTRTGGSANCDTRTGGSANYDT
jgi:hypothetical protein